MPRKRSRDSNSDTDVEELGATSAGPSSTSISPAGRPRRAAGIAGANKRLSSARFEEDTDDEIVLVSHKKGKAKATSDDEREHALERAVSRNKTQIDADAMLAAQLAAGDSDEDVYVIEDEEAEEELANGDSPNSDDDFDSSVPLRARKRQRTNKGKSNGAQPNGKLNGKASSKRNGKVNGVKKAQVNGKLAKKGNSQVDDSDEWDDSDFDADLTELDSSTEEDEEPDDTVDGGSTKHHHISNRLHRGYPLAGSVPDDWEFKKPDSSNYIKTEQNRNRRVPEVLRELAEKSRLAAKPSEAADAGTSVTRKPSKRGGKESADKPAKGSMQEEQQYETAKQRQARLRREAREAREAAAAARRGTRKRHRSHFERNKLKLDKSHPELSTVWKDLGDIELPAPQSAEPPTILAKGVKLLPFQLESLHWLTQQEDSHWQGGLLADEMGMGKTVQMIALMLSDEQRRDKKDKIRSTLVVAPTVAIMQWGHELAKYAPQFTVLVWHGANRADVAQVRKADVVLTSYAVIESSFRRQEQGFVRKGERFKEASAVHSIAWRRVILDEAHNIKDRSTNTARSAFALKAMYRWCLSGTPLQNRVGELFSMVRFIGAEPFANYYCLQCDCKSLHWNMVKGKFCAFCGHTPMQHICFWNNDVLKPIQRHGAEEGEGKDAFLRLRTLLQHMMLRRTKLERADDMGLPPRTIVVRRDVFNEEEADLYQSLYTDGQRKFTTFIDQGTVLNNYSNIFTLLTRMRQMACHPDLVLRSKTGSNAKLMGNLSETHVCKLCSDEAEDPIISACRHVFCRACIGEYVGEGEGQSLECPYCHGTLAIDLEQETLDAPRPEQNARQGLLSRLDLTKWRSSTKIEALVEELSSLRSEDHTIKSIVFSQFRSFLDLIALRLSRAGFKVARLEGNMTPQQRDSTIRYFSDNTSVTVFLISLKAGGVALNLVEASRVYLMDPWWNPSVEMQAADRIHRIGQHRPIVVKRMIIENSIEARIVELQNKKSAMIEAAIGKDDSAMGRLSVADLQFLFRQ